MTKLGAKELRVKEPTKKELAKIKRRPIFIVLDNILDTYNVGAIFRLADAVAASCVYLCGETATPDDPKVGHKIHKASVGVWKWTPWEWRESTVGVVRELREMREKNKSYEAYGSNGSYESNEIRVIAIEQDEKSISYEKADYRLPLVLVVGNETYGVSDEVLKMADQIVEIPLFGVNKSLNVMVSLAIVLYKVMERVKKI